MYDLGIWTYVIALTHYLGELVVFGGCKINGPFMSPLCVAGKMMEWMMEYWFIDAHVIVSSLIWMWQQYDYYVKYDL